MSHRLKSAALALFLFALSAGALYYAPPYISVSTSPGDSRYPICSAASQTPAVSITINVEGSEESLSSILAVLKAHRANAVFFVTKAWISKYPETLSLILEDGHQLGNMGVQSLPMTSLSSEEAREQLLITHRTVKQLTGTDLQFFRPPLGVYDDALLSAAASCGYDTVQWSLDSRDWKDYDGETICQLVCEDPALKSGAILLFRSDGKNTPRALDLVLSALKQQGFQTVSLSGLLKQSRELMDSRGRLIYHPLSDAGRPESPLHSYPE